MRKFFAIMVSLCLMATMLAPIGALADGESVTMPTTVYRPEQYATHNQISVTGISDPVYTIEGEEDFAEGGITVDANGVLTVSPEASTGDYTLTVTSESNSEVMVKKDFKVSDTQKYANTVETWTANGHTSATANDTVIGDYMVPGPTTRIANSTHIDVTSVNGGSITFEYDLGPKSTKLMQIVGLQDSDTATTYGTWYPSTFTSIKSLDTWSHIIMTMDFVTRKYQIFRDGELIMQNDFTSAGAAKRICAIYGLIISGDANAKLANVKMYTGTPEIAAIKAPGVVYRSGKYTTRTNISASGVSNPVFSVEGGEGVTINSSTGVMTILPTASEGTYTIKVRAANNAGPETKKSFILKNAHSYANTAATWKANNHTSQVAHDDIIGDYLIPLSTAGRLQTSSYLEITSENGGSVTLEYDLGPKSTKLMEIVGLQDSVGGNSYTSWYPGLSTRIAALDKWSHIIMTMNFDTNKYTVYRDSEIVMTGDVTSAGKINNIRKVYGLVISGDNNTKLANVEMYTGAPVFPVLKAPATLYRSDDYVTRVNVSADDVSDPVFSVEGGSGVSIDSATGVMTVQPTAEKSSYTVKVESASNPILKAKKVFELTDAHLYANTAETWNGNGHTSVVKHDDVIGDYLTPGSTGRIQNSGYLDISSENGGNVTVEYDIGPGSTKLLQFVGLQDKEGANTYTSWYPANFKALKALETWSHIVMVMDFDTQKYKVYRDGDLIDTNDITSAGALNRIRKVYGLLITGDSNAKLANVKIFSGEPEKIPGKPRIQGISAELSDESDLVIKSVNTADLPVDSTIYLAVYTKSEEGIDVLSESYIINPENYGEIRVEDYASKIIRVFAWESGIKPLCKSYTYSPEV